MGWSRDPCLFACVEMINPRAIQSRDALDEASRQPARADAGRVQTARVADRRSWCARAAAEPDAGIERSADHGGCRRLARHRLRMCRPRRGPVWRPLDWQLDSLAELDAVCEQLLCNGP